MGCKLKEFVAYLNNILFLTVMVVLVISVAGVTHQIYEDTMAFDWSFSNILKKIGGVFLYCIYGFWKAILKGFAKIFNPKNFF